MTLFERLDSHRYLYLTQLSEPEDNALRLQIEEGRVGPESEPRPAGNIRDEIMHLGAPIFADERSAAYEVIFSEYVAYAVRNESYTVDDPDESHSGRLCCVFTKSKFLDFVAVSTIVSDEYPGPIRHFGFNCLNHIVDVASVTEPAITVLRTGLRVDA